MVPFLNLEPILQAPAGHPVTEAEAIQLVWGAVNSNFWGFRGIPAVRWLAGRESALNREGVRLSPPAPAPAPAISIQN